MIPPHSLYAKPPKPVQLPVLDSAVPNYQSPPYKNPQPPPPYRNPNWQSDWYRIDHGINYWSPIKNPNHYLYVWAKAQD